MIHPFIFNWNGTKDSTLDIQKQLCVYNNLTIINSYEDYTEHGWIDIHKDAHFGEQFAKALELFDGEVLFHIQGDASYHNWQLIINSAINYFKTTNCGIYAPNVDYTYWDHKVIESQFQDKLYNVTSTDCTAWFLHKDIINELKKYKSLFLTNKYGWGIPFLASGICKKFNKIILRDYNFTVSHPKSTNYHTGLALQQRNHMLKCLPRDLLITVINLYNYQNKCNYINDN